MNAWQQNSPLGGLPFVKMLDPEENQVMIELEETEIL